MGCIRLPEDAPSGNDEQSWIGRGEGKEIVLEGTEELQPLSDVQWLKGSDWLCARRDEGQEPLWRLGHTVS